MAKKKPDNIDQLLKQVEDLTDNIARLEKIDADKLFTSKRAPRGEDDSRPRKPKANEKPDWVKSWNRKNARNGPVKTIVKTTDTFHEADGTIETKTELVDPIVRTSLKRDLQKDGENIFTGDETAFVEKVEEVGLPEHLRLDKLHEDRKPTINWADQPKDDLIVPRGIAPARSAKLAINPNSDRGVREYIATHQGNPLVLRDEGPTKPVRKQMLRLNKVWKYRNFKKCTICDHYDTWEARTDPYADGPKGVHAEIWCHTCGAVDFEVADNMPAHIGTWAPPKETEKEIKLRRARQSYRRHRAIFSLVKSPKTPMELAVWFREVEKYEGVDPIMLELMLKRMRAEGLVVLEKDGRWWEREDHEFEHPEQYNK